MSALLGLREWLNLDEAVRYIEHMGLQGTKKDLLLAYNEMALPLRMTNVHIGTLFPDNSYPLSLCAWLDGDGKANLDDGAELHYLHGPVSIRPPKPFDTVVTIDNPLTILEPFDSHPESAPVYEFNETATYGERFSLITWPTLINELSFKLLLRREDVEKVAQSASGKKQPTSDKRNWPLIAGALLNQLTESENRNSSGVIAEIADKGIRGLGKRTLEGALAEAARAYKENSGD